MLDIPATRARFIEWAKSPAFDARFAAVFPKRRWPYPVAAILLVVAFLIGRMTGKIEPLFVLVIVAMMLLLHGYNHGRRRAAARRDAHLTLQDHVPVFGIIVIGNTTLFGSKGMVAPALLLGTFDFSGDSLPNLIAAAPVLMDLYGKDPATVPTELREACQLINDDNYQPNRRRRVPQSAGHGDNLFLFDLLVVSDDLPASLAEEPGLICMASPQTGGSILHVPAGVPVFEEEEEEEETESSHPNIIRHKVSDNPPPMVAPYSDNMDAVDEHISRHLGKVDNVFHELLSTTVHIDVHIVPAAPGRPWISLVTSGMSDIPMTAPAGAEGFRFAELMIRLPEGWKLEQADLKNEENYWPIHTLQFLARFPHEYTTWLCYGHTIPNGNPPAPLAPDIPFIGVALAPPSIGGKEFAVLHLKDGTPVHFWSLIPLYASEMDFKLAHGADALFARLHDAGYDDLFDPSRPPVA